MVLLILVLFEEDLAVVTMAEYIWVDGQKPVAKLRSKTKILKVNADRFIESQYVYQLVQDDLLPKWGFDGSSTEQAEGHFSDCMLVPVFFVSDPIRGHPHILVLCEVMNPDGSSHISNTRAMLREVEEQHKKQEPLFGIEQEYTLYGKNNRPFGWPREGFPQPQGKYYCGVGYDEVHGRPLVEAHMKACLDAGLAIAGTNAEVMPAQWEFQTNALGPLEVGDHLWVMRWLLYRLGEDFSAYAKLDPKPMSGDWNGAGGHTNFSTKAMRESGGIETIYETCERLKDYHEQHMRVYGAYNDKRLTGKHETCKYDQFRYGVSDRGASVRIPMETTNAGKGYLEDRRPAANMDPYKVATALIETTCGSGFDPEKYGWVSKDCQLIS